MTKPLSTRRRFWMGGVVALGLGMAACAYIVRGRQAVSAPAAAQVAYQPAPRIVFGKISPAYLRRHEIYLAYGQERLADLLFLGDSITEGWNTAPDVWAEHYGKYDPANFGISGDQTQNVLWRIDNGELDHIRPRVVVLLIGTNNIPDSTAEDIIRADTKIVAEIYQKLPLAKVLLLGIFPRGEDPRKPEVAAMRTKIKTVNAALAKLDDGRKTRYLDFGDKFLEKNGVLSEEIIPDALHPAYQGYEIWANAMQPLLNEMMR